MKIRRWQIAAVVVLAATVLTATAAWSWASLREERAAQVKAHSIFAFTDQFGQPAAGYRVRLCTVRLAWWSWLVPWSPYRLEQRDVTADDRGEVHVTGKHLRLKVSEIDRERYIAPLNWSATTPAGEQISWVGIYRPFEGRLVYGVLRRGGGDAPVSEWRASKGFDVKVRGCGSEGGTTGFVPLAVDGSGPEDGRLRFEAEAVTAEGRGSGSKNAYRGWRVRVVGEGAQVRRDKSGQLVTFAPVSGYEDQFEIDGATLGDAVAFARTKNLWWYVNAQVLFRPKDCKIEVLPVMVRTNKNGSNDLYDRLWTSNWTPDRCWEE